MKSRSSVANTQPSTSQSSCGNSPAAWLNRLLIIAITFIFRLRRVRFNVTTEQKVVERLIPACAFHLNRLIALAFMIHHVVLYKLKLEVTPARVEEMMMNTRMQLLKIPEVLSIKCGKRVDPEL